MENVKEIDGKTTGSQGCTSGCAPTAQSGGVNRRALYIGLAVAGAAGGLFLGWDWLVAAGLSTLIIGVLPCVAMCALGLCGSRMGKKEQKSGETIAAPAGPDAPVAKTTAPALESNAPSRPAG